MPRVSKRAGDEKSEGRMIEVPDDRKISDAIVSLVDLRHDPSADDVQMYEFLKWYEIPVIIVARPRRTRFPHVVSGTGAVSNQKKLNFDPSDDFILCIC